MGVSIDSWCIQSVNLDTAAETKSLGGKCICVWPKNCIQWDHFDTVKSVLANCKICVNYQEYLTPEVYQKVLWDLEFLEN